MCNCLILVFEVHHIFIRIYELKQICAPITKVDEDYANLEALQYTLRSNCVHKKKVFWRSLPTLLFHPQLDTNLMLPTWEVRLIRLCKWPFCSFLTDATIVIDTGIVFQWLIAACKRCVHAPKDNNNCWIQIYFMFTYFSQNIKSTFSAYFLPSALPLWVDRKGKGRMAK